MTITSTDLRFLRRALDLAAQALDAGDEPFGSVLVSADGVELFADHNRVAGGDKTRHPEFEIARFAANNLSAAERSSATVYTSGEHCPMCAAAHGWVGLGRIVYVTSAKTLASYLQEWGVPPSPVATIPSTHVILGAEVEGLDSNAHSELLLEGRELYRRAFGHGTPTRAPDAHHPNAHVANAHTLDAP